VKEAVRSRYAGVARQLAVLQADPGAGCCQADGPDCGCSGSYSADELSEIGLTESVSLGCGNPLMVAELHTGETVLDLGSVGGIDVLLSARRVGETGFAYGVDMTDEMLDLARANAVKAGAANVEFRKGLIEDLPLSDGIIDVVISNCVINLSADKPAVLAEMFRVLKPGGRIGISDVVAEDHLTPQMRAERGSYVGCIAGALSRTEYLDGLAAAGFTDADVTFTHEAVPGMHGAIVRATKPAGCCSANEQATCCEPEAKAGCCTDAGHATGTCGCR